MIILTYYFLGAKKEHTSTKTTKPTNPPSPNDVISAVKLATTSNPRTEVPVNTNHKIANGIKAKNKNNCKINLFI